MSGAFTEPPWQPVELEYEPTLGQGAIHAPSTEMQEYIFFKDFHVPEGSFQYKFRLGTGDWWVCKNDEMIGDSPL